MSLHCCYSPFAPFHFPFYILNFRPLPFSFSCIAYLLKLLFPFFDFVWFHFFRFPTTSFVLFFFSFIPDPTLAMGRLGLILNVCCALNRGSTDNPIMRTAIAVIKK